MKITGIFSTTCEKCSEQYDFAGNDADFDLTSTDERQHGTEKSYKWGDSFRCTCGQDIDFTYEVWEYPSGAFNHDDVKIQGGAEVDRYTYDFSS